MSIRVGRIRMSWDTRGPRARDDWLCHRIGSHADARSRRDATPDHTIPDQRTNITPRSFHLAYTTLPRQRNTPLQHLRVPKFLPRRYSKKSLTFERDPGKIFLIQSDFSLNQKEITLNGSVALVAESCFDV